MAKSAFEKALEKYQKEAAKNIKKKIDADKKLAYQQRRESERQAKLYERRERAASIVNGQRTIGDIKIIDVAAEELVSLIIEGYKRDDYIVTNNDVIVPDYLERDLPFEFEKLKQYGLIASYGYYISGCWEITIMPSLLSYFERKETASMQEKRSHNTNNFYGDVKGVQIQQGTVNSSQCQTNIQDFDYDAVSDIIKNIQKYDGMFDAEFGDKAFELRDTIGRIEELLDKREEPKKIKLLMLELKNLAVGVTGSLIASGIAAQIPMF